jgi:hypothetical protein
MTTVHRVARIAPLQAGKVASVMYGIFGVVMVPFFLLPALFGAKDALPLWIPFLFIPFYIIAGFVMTALMAWLYNVIVGWVGGLEITLGSDPGT